MSSTKSKVQHDPRLSNQYFKSLSDSYELLKAFDNSTKERLLDPSLKRAIKSDQISVYRQLLGFFDLVLIHLVSSGVLVLKDAFACSQY